jgi:hypothetical protein
VIPHRGGEEVSTSRTTCTLVVGLVTLLIAGMALPGQAGYTKRYGFRNSTGVEQSSVQAITNGLESIIDTYAYPPDWVGVSGYTLSGGVYCSTITVGGPPRPPDKAVNIGWTTADGSCRLRDMRWGDGQAIAPNLKEGVPGGGIAFYNYPNPGCLTVVITNDLAVPEGGDPQDLVINLADVEFATAGYRFDLEELPGIDGLVELRVASIDADIEVLRAEVEYYGEIGEISGPSANSLLKKLGRTVMYKHYGLDEHLGGDPDGALVFWAKAAKQMTNFISEVTAAAEKGNLAPELYDRWVVDGDGEIVPAPGIRDDLLALPEGQSLQSLPALPPGTLPPPYPGLDPDGYVPWSVAELWPGEHTAFVVCGLDLNAGFIMAGIVLDDNGDVALEWMEQSVAEPGVIDTQPPVIDDATATPGYLWPPEHVMVEVALDVTVSDNTFAVWYVEGVTSNQPEDGTGDGDSAPDWMLDPNDPQSLWLRAERSGNAPTEARVYTVTLRAIDTGGNLSAPYYLYIPVDHDQGE